MGWHTVKGGRFPTTWCMKGSGHLDSNAAKENRCPSNRLTREVLLTIKPMALAR